MHKKQEFLELITSNINNYGYHITIVNSPAVPRYAYTIGLSTKFNFELVFAGGIYYSKEDIFKIFDSATKNLNRDDKCFSVDSLGEFSCNTVEDSWNRLMMLGVFDFYRITTINTLQILPAKENYTLDIPIMSNKFEISKEPIWQWLVRKWDYSVPENSTVVTNIDAMKGMTITELARYEDNEWEMFAGSGPDIEKEDIRVVSLGSILGIDPSLLPCITLPLGKGLWRESKQSEWNSWG